MICDDCYLKKRCFEQRGQCKDFKSLKEIRSEIESINKTHKSAKRAETDKSSGRDNPQRAGEGRSLGES